MADFEEQLNLLVKSGNKIYSPVDIGILGHDITTSQWINDVEIFYNNYLENTLWDHECEPCLSIVPRMLLESCYLVCKVSKTTEVSWIK